jgi:DNA-binding response OmpR family regulator
VNKKVMIVDDDKDLLDELSETLRLSGYDIIAVNDSVSVMPEVLKIRPDVILLDLKMPGKTGFIVANELRRSNEFNNIPIITMTGFFNSNYESFVIMGMFGIKRCLKKPFNPLDVISAIESVLSQ